MGLGSDIPNEQTVIQRRSPELTKRILVVDDDPSVQKSLKRLFEAEGFAVEGHLDGRAGLDSFHADTPSAAILVYRFTKTYTHYPVVRASNFFHR
jgi:PleD family two-component response regulator